MVDIIIYIIIAVLLVFAIRSAFRRMSGKGGCCGGGIGSSLVKTSEKILDGPVVSTKTMRIEGMHCDACAERVKRAIDSIDGAAGKVDFKSGKATVNCDRNVDEARLRVAVKEAGYTVLSIS